MNTQRKGFRRQFWLCPQAQFCYPLISIFLKFKGYEYFIKSISDTERFPSYIGGEKHANINFRELLHLLKASWCALWVFFCSSKVDLIVCGTSFVKIENYKTATKWNWNSKRHELWMFSFSLFSWGKTHKNLNWKCCREGT